MTYKPKEKRKLKYIQETFGLPSEWAEYFTEVIKDYPDMKRAQYLREQFIDHLEEVRKERLKALSATSPYYTGNRRER